MQYGVGGEDSRGGLFVPTRFDHEHIGLQNTLQILTAQNALQIVTAFENAILGFEALKCKIWTFTCEG